MIYYNKLTGNIVSDSNLIHINKDDYDGLYEQYKDDILLGDKSIVYNELTNTLSIYTKPYYVIVDSRGSFRISESKESLDAIEIDPKQYRAIQEEIHNGYIHYVSEGQIYKVKPNADEIFNWETKELTKIITLATANKREQLLNTDLYNKIVEVGVRYNWDGINVYYPLRSSNLVMLQLLRSSAVEDRYLTMYNIRDNALDPDSAKIFTKENVTDELLDTLIRKAIKYKSLLDNKVYEFRNRLETSTDIEETTNLVNNYADIIINSIEEEI